MAERSALHHLEIWVPYLEDAAGFEVEIVAAT